MSKKIVVVDDHPIVRQGLIQLIVREPDLVVTGEAEDTATALKIVENDPPDLMLVDLSLKSGNGIELVKDVTTLFPQVKVLVVTLHNENIYAERALRSGALGFVMKTEAIDSVLEAIREVLAGRVYVSPLVSSELLSQLYSPSNGRRVRQGRGSGLPFDSLSDRELEVLQLIGEGKGTSTIAQMLHLSVKTVETYRAHLKSKLGLRDSVELVQYAVKTLLGTNE